MLKHDTPRSSVVQNMAGKTYRRNQSHMFRTRENPPTVLPKDDYDIVNNETEKEKVQVPQGEPRSKA